jgi:hypothetical protein
MSADHAKREIVTGEKSTSHGKAPSRESSTKGKEESPTRVKSYRSGDKKKDEEGGLLRDRFIITFYLWLRRAIRHF